MRSRRSWESEKIFLDTMKKRMVSEDEKILFKKTVDHTRPQVIARAKIKKPAGKAKAGSSGLDGNTQKKLHQGALAPAARLDLHGFTQDAAYSALMSFLQSSHKSGVRLTLVITGKGGVLKEMASRWLNQPRFAALIAGIEPAHIRHGETGALYVYLRK
jgi:DNA-nicking Smr family endonuclease